MKNKNDKTVVITGATSGIGFAIANELAKKGSIVIGVGKSEKKCKEAKQIIESQSPNTRVIYFTTDLSSFLQTNRLVLKISKFLERENIKGINCLINNAAIFGDKYILTENEIESQFAINHLAPFLLTNKLYKNKKIIDGSSIVMVTSKLHNRMKINWNDIQYRKRYNPLKSYRQSKLANIVFATELNRRLSEKSNIKSIVIDPGIVNTKIGLKEEKYFKILFPFRNYEKREPDEVAKIIIKEIINQNSNQLCIKNSYIKVPLSEYSTREDISKKLWEISEKMCGFKSHI